MTNTKSEQHKVSYHDGRHHFLKYRCGEFLGYLYNRSKIHANVIASVVIFGFSALARDSTHTLTYEAHDNA